jgi:hypothetical protein
MVDMNCDPRNTVENGREYFYPTSQAEWREWLCAHGTRSREIWLLQPHKSTGRPCISYFQALEEALCFGWIDGMVKRHGEDTLSRRFSPRATKSAWSEVNKQHARLLIESGKMTPLGFAVLPDLRISENQCADDIARELRADSVVWENFRAFPVFYRNIRIAAIESMRHDPEMFRRKLDYFMEQTRRNRRYGRFR